MEPFSALNRADSGIAQQYPDYRNVHRETTRATDEFVLPKTPPEVDEAAVAPRSPGTFYLLPPLLPVSDGNLAQEGIQ